MIEFEKYAQTVSLLQKHKFYQKYVKRVLDISLATIAIILLSPLLFITAILVSIKIGKPVLFKQKRPGFHEKIFTLYKFRTMTNSEDVEGNLLPDSIRLTKFGRILRATSIDELPELWNILKGEMSIVGPRPLVIEYIPLYTTEERGRHNMRPGLTGLAQINGRSFLRWEERFKIDNEYVNNCSFLLDCRIIFDTILQTIKQKNIADMGEIDIDENGEFVFYQGHKYRRLDQERTNNSN